MSTELVALGLLAEESLHGYELRQRFEERGMPYFTRLSFGALYHALRKLESRGLIARETTERVGRRPERVVYRITDDGRAELQRLLLEALTTTEQQYFAIDPALALSYHLTHDELVTALRERQQRQAEIVPALEAEREVVATHMQELIAGEDVDTPQIMTLGLSMINHAIAHERAELAWLDDLLKQVEALNSEPSNQ